MATAFTTAKLRGEAACPEDLNGDGAVGTPDLLLMLGE